MEYGREMEWAAAVRRRAAYYALSGRCPGRTEARAQPRMRGGGAGPCMQARAAGGGGCGRYSPAAAGPGSGHFPGVPAGLRRGRALCAPAQTG